MFNQCTEVVKQYTVGVLRVARQPDGPHDVRPVGALRPQQQLHAVQLRKLTVLSLSSVSVMTES